MLESRHQIPTMRTMTVVSCRSAARVDQSSCCHLRADRDPGPVVLVQFTLLTTALLCLSMGASAYAQTVDSPAPQVPHRAATLASFLAGGGLAFVIHEGGHLTFDTIFDAQPHVHAVHFGPIPFFAISPARLLTPRQLFTLASAGFWTQQLMTEVLLPHATSLREAHAPFVKGMLAFDILTSIGYAAVAFGRAGPPERDTRGMAIGLDVPEPVVGLLVLGAPRRSRRIDMFRRDPPGQNGRPGPSGPDRSRWSSSRRAVTDRQITDPPMPGAAEADRWMNDMLPACR
jgi:hypothetical protein